MRERRLDTAVTKLDSVGVAAPARIGGAWCDRKPRFSGRVDGSLQRIRRDLLQFNLDFTEIYGADFDRSLKSLYFIFIPENYPVRRHGASPGYKYRTVIREEPRRYRAFYFIH